VPATRPSMQRGCHSISEPKLLYGNALTIRPAATRSALVAKGHWKNRTPVSE
jgi:hypothetical protein